MNRAYSSSWVLTEKRGDPFLIARQATQFHHKWFDCLGMREREIEYYQDIILLSLRFYIVESETNRAMTHQNIDYLMNDERIERNTFKVKNRNRIEKGGRRERMKERRSKCIIYGYTSILIDNILVIESVWIELERMARKVWKEGRISSFIFRSTLERNH